MLIKTHIVMAIFVALLFLERVPNPYIFLLVVIISVFIPDMDSFNSKLGKRFFSRVLTAFTKHRGIMHSLLFLVIVYFVLYLYVPSIAFGFLVGYGVHLVGDMFTKQGVRLFYPFKFRIKGFIKTGGRIESFLFFIFLSADFFLIVSF